MPGVCIRLEIERRFCADVFDAESLEVLERDCREEEDVEVLFVLLAVVTDEVLAIPVLLVRVAGPDMFAIDFRSPQI